MPNAILIRTAAPGAKEAANDLNGVKTSMTGIGTQSSKLGAVNANLLEMTRSSRLLNREFKGVHAFAGALDTIAGTNLSGTIADIKTVAEVADPLKDLGQKLSTGVEDAVSGAWAKVPGSSKVNSAISTAGSKMAGGLKGALSSNAGMVGIGVAGALIIDAWGKEMATKIDGLRQQVVTQLGDDPIAAKKVQESLGPWRGFMDITGQVLENVPLLGEGTRQIGTDMRGLAGDVDTAATSFTGLQG